MSTPIGSKKNNRKPVRGKYDAAGNFTPDEVQQVESFLRYGCLALQQGKPLEESQQIGATALGLIGKLKSLEPPKAD